MIKIKRENALRDYPIFPLSKYDEEKDEIDFLYPKVFKSYVLTVLAKSFQGNAKLLATELAKLVTCLDANALIFLGDHENPWLHQHNEYKPVKEAQQYLTDNKIGKRFNGALKVGTAELPIFIKHLSWLIRCNAALPYFYFVDEGQQVLGSICKYGNLHLDTLNKKADNSVHSFLNSSKFEFADRSSCYNRFGKSSAIAGRQTIV